VVSCTPEPSLATQRLAELSPDVLVLGMEAAQPEWTASLAAADAQPVAVVLIISPAAPAPQAAAEAARLGAAAVVRPEADGAETERQFAVDLTAAVRVVGRRQPTPSSPMPPPNRYITGPTRPAADTLRPVLIGSSTGGTNALLEILSRLPATAPPIAVAQHMPRRFSASLVARLNRECVISVQEARDGDALRPGLALMAPGDAHLLVAGTPPSPRVVVQPGPRINHYRPSVDTLFYSAARILKTHAVGVLLSGMGTDGAHGLAAMHAAGAFTIAQDETSSVVYGMPAAAVRLGAVSLESPLDEIPHAILRAATASAP
jgi:two-component system chemotaxis response regulator CheB